MNKTKVLIFLNTLIQKKSFALLGGLVVTGILACQPMSLNNLGYPDNFGDDSKLSLDKSSISISGGTVAAGSTLSVTVTANDTLGNRYTNTSLTVACLVAGGTSAGTVGAATDNGDGTYALTLTGDVSGTASSVICTLDGGTITNTLPSVSVTFTPYEIATLELWLDASQLSLNNADPVSSWTDFSGNLNHAVQAAPIDQPTFNTNVINSLPAVNFDGASDHLQFGSINMQPATVFVVGRYGTPAATAPYLGNDTNNEFAGYSSSGSVFYLSAAASLTVADVYPTAFQLYMTQSNSPGTNSEIVIDGGQVVSADRNWGVDNFQFVGRRDAERFKGDIAEILVFSSSIAPADVTQIEAYLQTKYGI